MKKFWKVLRNSAAGHLIILFFLVFVLKMPILISQPPPFWDEMTYVEGVKHLVENRLDPFTFYYGYRPPFIIWTTAFLVRLFGHPLVITRLVIVFWAALAVIFTYLTIYDITKRRTEAFLAGVLLAFSPFFFAQAGIFQIEVPLAALTIIVTYFYIKKKWGWFGLMGMALVLTKEVGVYILFLIFGFELLWSLVQGKKARWTLAKCLAFLIPSFIFLSWCFLNKLIHGWWLWLYNFGLFTNFKGFFAAPFAAKLSHLKTLYSPTFGLQKIGHWNWLVFILIILGILFERGKLIKNGRVLTLLFLIFAFPLIFLGSGEYVLMRYLLPTFPLIFSLLGISCSKIVCDKNRIGAILMISLVYLFSVSWYGETKDWEANMRYLELTEMDQHVARVIENKYPGARILTHWPFSRELQSAFFGYVKRDSDSIFIDEENDGKSLDEWLLEVDYVLTRKNHHLSMAVSPYSPCLAVERKFSNDWEVIFLDRVDKSCLKSQK